MADQKTQNPNLEEAKKHFKAAHQELHESIRSLLPPEFRQKRRAARKEFLLGIRKIIDSAIDRNENEKDS